MQMKRICVNTSCFFDDQSRVTLVGIGTALTLFTHSLSDRGRKLFLGKLFVSILEPNLLHFELQHLQIICTFKQPW